MKFRFRHAVQSGRSATTALATLLLLSASALSAPADVEAQTQQQIEQQIEALGLENMSPGEIRERLRSLGYDPELVDRYLRGVRSGGDRSTDREIDSLQSLIPDQDSETDQRGRDFGDGAWFESPTLPDSSATEREMGLRVFGLGTFARRSSEFRTVTSGPIPAGYVLGPGDEVVVILTGDVEDQHVLPVTREGFIVVPGAGQLWVNGLTMAELRERLYGALGRIHSGLGRGPEATVHLEVSLGRTRSNDVFLTGEVRWPGAYTTSALASVLNPLYLAGGPLPTGSFRNIHVLRNGQRVDDVDLYDYLTRGSSINDLVLNPGDVIFVPPAATQVGVRGAVTREGLYEIRDGETLLDVLEFAGGLTAPAALGRARVNRILPPSQRTQPGLDRTVIDVDLAAVVRGEVPPPELYDGDEIQIFRVRPELRQVITVSGPVWKECILEAPPRRSEPERAREERPDSVTLRPDSLSAEERDEPQRVALPKPPPAPCTFQYAPGMSAWDAIEAAEGLRPEAYRQRAQIVRMNPADSTLSIISFSLELDENGVPVENPALSEFDALRVFSRTDFQDSLAVRVSGEVRHPGRGSFQYRQGMTLEDLLLEAGGLTPEADLMVEISRRPDAADRREGRMSETVRIPVDESYIISEEGIRFYPGDTANEDGEGPSAASFLLRPHDQIFVRRVPNLAETARTITIEGEVTYPGSYALRSKDERLSEVVQRAGGLTNTAFAGGFRLYRNDQLVNIDLPELLREPGSDADLILLPGDSMVVPEYDPVVVVQGAVNSPAAVLYKQGADLDYYIGNAGGYTRDADRESVNVRFANGEGAVRENLLFFSRSPSPGPGSVVHVPVRSQTDDRDFLDILGSVAQMAGTITTLLLVLDRF